MSDSRNDDTFYKVTNGDIYKKLLDIEKTSRDTQSTAKKAQVLSTTALTISILVLGYFISSLL